MTDLPVSSTSLPFENQNRLVIEGSMKGAIAVFVNVVVASCHATCCSSSGRIRSGFSQT